MMAPRSVYARLAKQYFRVDLDIQSHGFLISCRLKAAKVGKDGLVAKGISGEGERGGKNGWREMSFAARADSAEGVEGEG